MLRDKRDYYEISRGEGYDMGIILGRTEHYVSFYRHAIDIKKRALQLKCKTEAGEQEKEEVIADIEDIIEHISFKDDLERFNKKYPGRSVKQLAEKICAESEYRYVINRWIKFSKEEKTGD